MVGNAQQPGRIPQSMMAGRQMNVGHFYGRIIDDQTNKGVAFATVQLFQRAWDTATLTIKDKLVAATLTAPNGDFSLTDLPLLGEYRLQISAIGYDSLSRKVSFDLDFKSLQQGNWQKALSGVDKDLGNLRLTPSVVVLGEVVVSGATPLYRVELDKRVYTPAKDPSNAGLTAEEVLKKIPSVSVDLDGNITLRNASPQLLVDGRPTTLAMDQIPSEVIDKIEVITNPSARYDASGGQSGIINVVLKKNRRMGYHGNLRGGVDMRGRLHGGGDISIRQQKVNLFATTNYHQRKSISYGLTERFSSSMPEDLHILQHDTNTAKGRFAFVSGGVDYFVTNRSTLTVSGHYVQGRFLPLMEALVRSDTIDDAQVTTSFVDRFTETKRQFGTAGSMLAFKHLFPRKDEELTADLTWNQTHAFNSGSVLTRYYDANWMPLSPQFKQVQEGSSDNVFVTAQTDYKRPLNERTKWEMGGRGAYRRFASSNQIFVADPIHPDTLYPVPDINSYTFTDQVYAVYAILGQQFESIQYQIGLRLESSFYEGVLTETQQRFENNFPVSVFPSGFVTYLFDNENDMQLSYTRRVDRPGFFQLLPYIDYSDSLNLSRGNPDLKPQFTHTVELSWNHKFSQNNHISVTAYLKNTERVITRYQQLIFDTLWQREVVVNTFRNGNMSNLLGAEFLSMIQVGKDVSLSLHANLFQTFIDGTNIEEDLTNRLWSWYAKVNGTWRLPHQFSVQLSADYQSKSAVTTSGGGRWMGMGMGMGGGSPFGLPPATVQGYVEPIFYVDASVRKEFFKNRNMSVTLSVSDVFGSRRHVTFYETDFFTQSAERLRDPHMVRLSASYRFGKFDTQLLRRKHFRLNNELMQDSGFAP